MAELQATLSVGTCVAPEKQASSCIEPDKKSADLCVFNTQKPLFPCSLLDASVVGVELGPVLASFSGADVYGSFGYVSLHLVAATLQTRPLWKQCSNVVYCDGPQYEGETGTSFSRFQTRWRFMFVGGLLFYGVVGKEEIELTSLFPNPVVFDSFSVCFDQNSIPVVVFCFGSTIELRRNQAGLVTSTTFSGTSPVLFQNALLQFDDTIQDVVCYYLKDGNLYGRWQRENFLVEYLLISNVDVDELFCVRASSLYVSPKEYLFCQKGCSTRLLVSKVYPPWPFVVEDEAAILVSPVTGIHARLLVDVPGSSDAAAVSVGPVTGIYRPTILQLPAASDAAAVSLATVTGIHKSVLVQAGSYSDAAAVSVGTVTGRHKFTLIQVGSYSDAASLTVGPVTGVHAHV